MRVEKRSRAGADRLGRCRGRPGSGGGRSGSSPSNSRVRPAHACCRAGPPIRPALDPIPNVNFSEVSSFATTVTGSQLLRGALITGCSDYVPRRRTRARPRSPRRGSGPRDHFIVVQFLLHGCLMPSATRPPRRRRTTRAPCNSCAAVASQNSKERVPDGGEPRSSNLATETCPRLKSKERGPGSAACRFYPSTVTPVRCSF